MDFPGSSDGKESVCNVRDLGSISGLGIPTPVKWMATNSGIPAWRITWTEEPRGCKELDMTE